MFSIRKIKTKTEVNCIMLRHCFEKYIKVPNKSKKVLLTYKNHHENRFTRETMEQLFEILFEICVNGHVIVKPTKNIERRLLT